MLPEEVLKTAAAEMLEYGATGQSVMEMSHRSKEYQAIFDEAEANLRELMNIPDDYYVLFLQGGASTQFAMVPFNLMNKNGKADYIITGQWANKAYKEAARYGKARAVASSADKTFSYIPKTKREDFDPEADYVHICMNNTIYGTKYHELPDTGDIPLVADISSCILSEPIDVKKFGVLYAGAQKNVAPAGVVILIVREDLLGRALPITPKVMDFAKLAAADSMLNTPNCFGIYVAGLTFKWIKAQGGVAALEARNIEKAKLLYDYLDESKLFTGTAQKRDRSRMNVTFVTGDAELDAKFVKEAAAQGLVNLKGHRIVGGMRASIYNAMPVEGVQKLVDFMKQFETEN